MRGGVMKDLSALVNYYKNLVKESGTNLKLPHPFKLTPKDLCSNQPEYRSSASASLSRFGLQNNFSHGLHNNDYIHLDQFKKSITLFSIISQEELYLPLECILLDYESRKYFKLKLDLTSRKYESTVITQDSGLFTFPLAELTYQLSSLQELTPEESSQIKEHFTNHWALGQNPLLCELHSWVNGEFRREHLVNPNKKPSEVRANLSEKFLQDYLASLKT